MKADAVKVPTFDGDEANFPVWKMRFYTFAKLKNFKQALVKDGEMNLPLREDEVIDTTTEIGAKQKAAMHRNDVAMACLTMAFTSETLIGMVYKSQTLLWPSGRAHIIMSSLMEQYEPKDRTLKVEMRKRLNGVKLSSGENPKKMFEQLAAIQNAYSNSERNIGDDELVAVVLGQAPKAYTTVLATEERIRGDNLTLKDLEQAMNVQWRISGVDVDEQEAEESELGLSSFAGTCYKCKKSGHKAFQC